MKSWMVTLETLPDIIPELLDEIGTARVVLVEGPMGAGKTTLVSEVCKYLKIKDVSSSPTYAIINEYHYDQNGTTKKIHHMDLYRLTSIEEAINIGIEEYLDQDQYCFIEWPTIIEPFLPQTFRKIEIQLTADFKRNIILL